MGYVPQPLHRLAVPPVDVLPSQLLCYVFLKRACQGSLVLSTLDPPLPPTDGQTTSYFEITENES